MYRGFRRSRIVMGVTLALTVALTVFVWMRNRGRAVYIPVLASVLLLGIGCTAARLLGNITASVACTGMLGILHMDLDPEAFLEQFLPVARRIPGESRDGMVCRFYLSDSYFAAGRYAEAKSVLGELPARFYTDAPVAGVWYADLARAELALGENADEAMEGLRGIIALSGGKAALRKNLQESLSLLEARRDAAAGQPVDREQLEAQLKELEGLVNEMGEISGNAVIDPTLFSSLDNALKPEMELESLEFLAEDGRIRLPEMGGGVERLRTDIPGSSFGNDKNTL